MLRPVDFGARARLCFALDVPDEASALVLVDELKDDVGVVKVGLELFVACGPSIVRAVRARGVDVFLDLKLHDIGNTVAAAVARAVDLDVRFLTVHASGGPAMLAAAAKAAHGSRTTLLAVTALTSLTDGDLARAGFAHGTTTLVPLLARLSADYGVGGVVCSPQEVEAVKRVAPSLLAVTPGVRQPTDDKGDQARTATAAEAIACGADVVVVGRPIKSAHDRRAAARRFVDDIARGLDVRLQDRSPR